MHGHNTPQPYNGAHICAQRANYVKVRTIRVITGRGRDTCGRDVSVIQLGRRRSYADQVGAQVVEGGGVSLTIRATKFESAYTDTSTHHKERCAICVNFMEASCKKVMGVINPNGRCRQYERELRVVSDTKQENVL